MSAVHASWASSGAAWLTGRSDGPPLGPPAGLPPTVDALGTELGVDAWQLLVERAASAGFARRGSVSCGGATRLLPAGDGWIAVSLAREADRELIPAWLACAPIGEDVWTTVAEEVRRRPVRELDERAALLGLPVGVIPSSTGRGEGAAPVRLARGMGPLPASGRAADPRHPFDGLPIGATRIGAPRTGRPREPFVVDLSSLWAGPLCTRLLADAGHRVVKVESTGRPDAARHGDGAFFDRLHAGKRSVALDFADPDGVSALHRLVAAADVVVEASRPRALRQLGIDASALLHAASGPSVWVSLTARGRTGAAANRVGFGDDVAAAAGLVVEDDEGPVFCADAIADPLSGLVAAAATQRAWRDGRRWLLDVAMIDVAAAVTGPTLPLPAGTPTPAPRRSSARGLARPFGADTQAVMTQVAARNGEPAER